MTEFRNIFNAVLTHLQSSGLFEVTAGHEFKSAPRGILSACVYAPGPGPAIESIPARSGLASTAKRLMLVVRVHMNMLYEPQDEIEPTCLGAVESLFDAFSGDFELGSEVAYVDVLGMHGTRMSASAGYITIDNTMFRVFTISVPIVLTSEATQNG